MIVEICDLAVVVRLTEDEMANPALLEEAFENLMRQVKQRGLLLDLNTVQRISSLGVAVMLAAQGLAIIHGTRMVVASVNKNVCRVLAMTGADKMLCIADTVDDGMRLFHV